MDIPKSESFQDSWNQFDTGSVNRSIDDGQILLTFDDFGIYAQVLHHLHIGLVDLLFYQGDEVFSTRPFDIVNRGDGLDFCDHIFIMWRHQLASIHPVGLVTIVFAWVVRGGTNDTTLASEVTDGKGQFRCGSEFFKQKHPDAVGRHH